MRVMRQSQSIRRQGTSLSYSCRLIPHQAILHVILHIKKVFVLDAAANVAILKIDSLKHHDKMTNWTKDPASLSVLYADKINSGYPKGECCLLPAFVLDIPTTSPRLVLIIEACQRVAELGCVVGRHAPMAEACALRFTISSLCA